MKTPLPPHCPCCGLLFESPLDVEVCPCCTYSPGDNISDSLECWINDGMPWLVGDPPSDWSPVQNLGCLALRVTTARVRGRPPRMKLN